MTFLLHLIQGLIEVFVVPVVADVVIEYGQLDAKDFSSSPHNHHFGGEVNFVTLLLQVHGERIFAIDAFTAMHDEKSW